MSGMDLDLVVRARRAVVGVYGTLRPCSLGVRAGRIVAVEAYGAGLDAAEIVDLAADEVLLPGLVDAVSAYHGRRLTGLVRRTWLRGRPADGEPEGRLLGKMDEPAGLLAGTMDEPAGLLAGTIDEPAGLLAGTIDEPTGRLIRRAES